MSNTEYVRQSADKYGWKKYYSTLRPVSMGTQPKDGFMDFVNYDDRTEVDGKMVWAELYYNRELSEKEMISLCMDVSSGAVTTVGTKPPDRALIEQLMPVVRMQML